jgi:hypothetical protein
MRSRPRDASIEIVLRGDADVLPQRGARVGARVEATLWQEGYDLIHESVDAVFVDVRRVPESVDRARLDPFLNVVNVVASMPGRCAGVPVSGQPLPGQVRTNPGDIPR